MKNLQTLLNRSQVNKTKKAYHTDKNSDTKFRIEFCNPTFYIFMNGECVGTIKADQENFIFNSYKQGKEYIITEIMHVERIHFDGCTNAQNEEVEETKADQTTVRENSILGKNLSDTLNQFEQIKNEYPEYLEKAHFISNSITDLELLNETIEDLQKALKGNVSSVSFFMQMSDDGYYIRLANMLNQIIGVDSAINSLEEIYSQMSDDDSNKNHNFMLEVAADRITDTLSDDDFELKEKIEEYRGI